MNELYYLVKVRVQHVIWESRYNMQWVVKAKSEKHCQALIEEYNQKSFSIPWIYFEIMDITIIENYIDEEVIKEI